MNPLIKVVDKCPPFRFTPEDKHRFQVKIEKVKMVLALNYLKSPFVSLRKLVRDIIFDRSIDSVA
jgi:hypothetical protein